MMDKRGELGSLVVISSIVLISLFFAANNDITQDENLVGQASQVARALGSTACNDGIDNDNDGFIDFGSDLGCYGSNDNDETAGPPEEENGWYTYDKHSDTQIIYVSNSEGNDNNDGSINNPVKTLAKGESLLRSGKPDWLLLKSGDIWDKQHFVIDTTGGPSEEYPQIIGAYGNGARPKIIPDYDKHGIDFTNDRINYFVVNGIHLSSEYRDLRNPNYIDRPGDVRGIQLIIGQNEDKYVKKFIVQDTKIEYFDSNTHIQDQWARNQGEAIAGRLKMELVRNIIQYSTSTDSHAIGSYIEGTKESKIRGNFYFHNGWMQSAQQEGDRYEYLDYRKKEEHNIYAQRFNGKLIAERNIFARASTTGMQMRAGGDFICNAFVGNAIALWMDKRYGQITHNIVTESDDIMPGDLDKNTEGQLRRGAGMIISDPANIQHNWIVHKHGTAGNQPAFEVTPGSTFENNYIYDWPTWGIKDGEDRSAGPVNYGGWGTHGQNYPSSYDKTFAKYANSIGLSEDNNAFYDVAANRARGEWPRELSAPGIYEYFSGGQSCPGIDYTGDTFDPNTTEEPGPLPGPTPNPDEPECFDGIDNDGDGLIDFADDKGVKEGKQGVAKGCHGPNKQETNTDNGFTLHDDYDDIYYVSTSGSDSNDGLTPSTAVSTIAKAMDLAGSGDWVLLKTGDIWEEKINVRDGQKNGNPFLVGAYGNGQRPKILNQDLIVHGNVDGVVVKGLHFENRNDVFYAIEFLRPASDILLEDNFIEGYYQNIATIDSSGEQTIQFEDIVLNRNIVVDAHGEDGRAIGFFMGSTKGTLLKENLFDHNGYNNNGERYSSQSHNMYAHPSNDPVTLIGNFNTRAGANAIRPGAGLFLECNVFSRNPVMPDITFSSGGYSERERKARMVNNAFLEGLGLDYPVAGTTKRGWGPQVRDVNGIPSGFTMQVENNIISSRFDEESQVYIPGITIKGGSDYNDVSVKNNAIYKWAGQVHGEEYGIASDLIPYLQDTNNAIDMIWDNQDGNTVDAGYSDPERTLAEYYYTQILGNSPRTLSSAERTQYHNEFLEVARTRPLGVWWSDYSAAAVYNWIAEGVDLNAMCDSSGGTSGPSNETPGTINETSEPSRFSDEPSTITGDITFIPGNDFPQGGRVIFQSYEFLSGSVTAIHVDEQEPFIYPLSVLQEAQGDVSVQAIIQDANHERAFSINFDSHVDSQGSLPTPETNLSPNSCFIPYIDECNDGADNDGDNQTDSADNGGSLGVALGCFGPNRQESDTDYGWVIHKNPDRIIYVSNAGNDNNDGLTPSTSVKTFDKGYELIRDGHSDWLLLRRGDIFESSSDIRGWNKDGASANAPIVVGSYGNPNDDRPLINSNGDPIIISSSISYVTFTGLHMYGNERDPSGSDYAGSGSNTLGVSISRGNHIIFDDVLIEFFRTNLMLSPNGDFGDMTNVLLNRVTLANSYDRNSDSHGLYTKRITGLTIDESVITHNGWDPDVDTSVSGRDHNVYLNAVRDTTISCSILGREGWLSLKIRGPEEIGVDGATEAVELSRNINVLNNVFLEGYKALSIGSNPADINGERQNGYNEYISTEDVLVDNNLFVRWEVYKPRGSNTENVNGEGFGINNARDVTVTNNMFVDKGIPLGHPAYHSAIKMNRDEVEAPIVIAHNFIHWPDIDSGDNLRNMIAEFPGFVTPGSYATLTNNTVVRFQPGEPQFEQYYSSLGRSGTVEDYLQHIMRRSKQNWDDRLNPLHMRAWYEEQWNISDGTFQPTNESQNTCFNGLQDGDETGVDCGGSCGICSSNLPLITSFVTEPSTIQIGSETNLEVVLGQDYASEADNIVFQTWSTVTRSIEEPSADYEAPFIYGHSSLDGLTPGNVSVQALIRNGNAILKTLRFDAVVLAEGCSVDTDCDDSIFCNGEETCQEGVCVSGTSPTLDDGISCTVDVCDEELNIITHTPSNSLCDDGLFCNGEETCDLVLDCQTGTQVNCDDGVSCTLDVCDETSRACVHTADNTQCGDGLYCNGDEICDPVLDCVSATLPSCFSDVSCGVASCSEGDDLTDGIGVCNQDNSACECLTNSDCNDNNICTTNTCENNVCVVSFNTNSCDDGLFCTIGDSCQEGSCVGTQRNDIDDGISCTIDSCDEDTDQIKHIANNAVCNDGLYCNGEEFCDLTLGCTAGAEIECVDSLSCTLDSCNEETNTCEHSYIDNDNDGFSICSGDNYDCDNENPDIHPGATEICDEVDNNCNGQIDEGCSCSDYSLIECTDGTVCQGAVSLTGDTVCCHGTCAEPTFLSCEECVGENCDTVTCNSIPQGCFHSGDSCQTCAEASCTNYLTEESCTNNRCGISNCGWSGSECVSCTDNDRDLYFAEEFCNANNIIDCNDEDTLVNPNAEEICDGKDNDCDGNIDNIPSTLCPLTQGVCQGSVSVCDPDREAVFCTEEHYGPHYENTEVSCTDGLDNDCDGVTDCEDINCATECNPILPLIQLSSPEAREYRNRIIPLEYTVESADECWVTLNGTRSNLSCREETTIESLNNNERLETGTYEITLFAKSGEETIQKEVIFTVIYDREVAVGGDEFLGVGETTPLDDLTDSELENIDLVIDDGVHGRIEFENEVDLTGPEDTNTDINLDDGISIEENRIEVDSENFPQLNQEATLIFYDVTFQDPAILRDDQPCTDCVIQDYNEGVLTFSVPGFSVYTVEETPLAPAPSTSGGGGGGGGGGAPRKRVQICTPDWQCTAWTECINGYYRRECTDTNGCNDIPPETRERCGPDLELPTPVDTEEEVIETETETAVDLEQAVPFVELEIEIPNPFDLPIKIGIASLVFLMVIIIFVVTIVAARHHAPRDPASPLLGFMRALETKGYSEEYIINELKNKGYSEGQIAYLKKKLSEKSNE